MSWSDCARSQNIIFKTSDTLSKSSVLAQRSMWHLQFNEEIQETLSWQHIFTIIWQCTSTVGGMNSFTYFRKQGPKEKKASQMQFTSSHQWWQSEYANWSFLCKRKQIKRFCYLIKWHGNSTPALVHIHRATVIVCRKSHQANAPEIQLQFAFLLTVLTPTNFLVTLTLESKSLSQVGGTENNEREKKSMNDLFGVASSYSILKSLIQDKSFLLTIVSPLVVSHWMRKQMDRRLTSCLCDINAILFSGNVEIGNFNLRKW